MVANSEIGLNVSIWIVSDRFAKALCYCGKGRDHDPACRSAGSSLAPQRRPTFGRGFAAPVYLSPGRIFAQTSIIPCDAFSKEIIVLLQLVALAACSLCSPSNCLNPGRIQLIPDRVTFLQHLGLCLFSKVIQLFLPFEHGVGRVLIVRFSVGCWSAG